MRAYKLSFLTLIVVSTLVSLTSCGVNSNIMFKVPKGDVTYMDSVPLVPQTEYRIAPDDKITFNLSTNNGEKVIDAGAKIPGEATQAGARQVEYLVKRNGMVELPVIHDVKVSGLTVVECENLLESLYSSIYEDPFIQLTVTNQRVVVFSGSGSAAKVISLANNNTTLMEVIALSGGIADRGKAKSVKLMRMIDGKRKVFVLDLSVIEGLKFADLIVQANDYIYIEPTPQLARELVKEIAPVISIVSSAIVVFSIINLVK